MKVWIFSIIAERDGDDRQLGEFSQQTADQRRSGDIGQAKVDDGQADIAAGDNLGRFGPGVGSGHLVAARLLEGLTDQNTKFWAGIGDQDWNLHASTLASCCAPRQLSYGPCKFQTNAG